MQNLLNEFVEPDYVYVGFWPRFWAIVLDSLLLGSVLVVFFLIVGESTNPAIIILSAFLPFLYNPTMEYRYGATVGKMAMKIKIVNSDLQKLTLNNVIFRNFIYFAIQVVSVTVELYNVKNNPENTLEGFKNMSDIFTPQLTSDLFFAFFVLVIYMVELSFMLTDEKYRSLHDRIGKTYVVKKLS